MFKKVIPSKTNQASAKPPGPSPEKAGAPPAAKSGPPAGRPAGKPASKSSKQGGGCGPTTLLLPLLLVALLGGAYFAFTRLSGGKVPAIPFLSASQSAAPTADAALSAAPTDAAQASDSGVRPTAKKKKAKETPGSDTAASDGSANPPAGNDPSANGAAVQPTPADLSAVPNPTASGIVVAPSDGSASNPPANTAGGANPSAANAVPPVGAASACAGRPKFLDTLGLGNDAVFSTTEPNTRGLFVTASSAESGGASTTYQHQSWNKIGYLDAFVMDRDGNVYVAPSPRTGPGLAAPKNQDRVFKVDTNSGVLAPYIVFPNAGAASPDNPYGVLGLAYDCDSGSLYAATISGSSAANPSGRIFRVDTGSGQVAGQLDKTDAYGLAVHSSGSVKSLYFGSPFDAQVRAVDLDAQGNFQGTPRVVAALTDPQRARSISFDDAGNMIVEAVQFTTNQTDIPQGAQVRFQYDAASDKWTPLP